MKMKSLYIFCSCFWYAVHATNCKHKNVKKQKIQENHDLPPKDNSHYIESVSWDIWMPSMKGELELVHLPGYNHSSRFFQSSVNCDDVYTEAELYIGTIEDNELFQKPMLLITHDWRQNISTESCQLIRKEALRVQNSELTVLFFDWSNVAMRESYPHTVEIVNNLAQELANFIEDFDIRLDKLHMVGHGLGVHILGSAGRILAEQASKCLRSKKNWDHTKIVSRITGLDPAGPLFYQNLDAINVNDANYVEIIHTDILKIGLYKKGLGHAQFLVNGGFAVQPGCKDPACSHNRAYVHFVNTFNSSIEYRGSQCPENFDLVGPCNEDMKVSMGKIEVDKSAAWSPKSLFFKVTIEEDRIDDDELQKL